MSYSWIKKWIFPIFAVFILSMFLRSHIVTSVQLSEMRKILDSTKDNQKIMTAAIAELSLAVNELKVPEIVKSEVKLEPELISMGMYTVTGYCPCEICCGEWANNRPNGIVYGASGEILISGVSCGVRGIDYGTRMIIDGYGEVIAHDTGADWVFDRYDGKLIDVYFDTHEKAYAFGKRTVEVFAYGS